MNENIDLTKILKNCPKGTKLYSSVNGEVFFLCVDNEFLFRPIEVLLNDGTSKRYSKKGEFNVTYKGECVLFPSKDQRDWSKFSAPWYKKGKFNPKTLKPFDKVLVRDNIDVNWNCDLLSYIIDSEYYPYRCIGSNYIYCIPYNDDTKHLVGTKEEAPEYYRYWED